MYIATTNLNVRGKPTANKMLRTISYIALENQKCPVTLTLVKTLPPYVPNNSTAPNEYILRSSKPHVRHLISISLTHLWQSGRANGHSVLASCVFINIRSDPMSDAYWRYTTTSYVCVCVCQLLRALSCVMFLAPDDGVYDDLLCFVVGQFSRVTWSAQMLARLALAGLRAFICHSRMWWVVE